jgi:hypothetical protein
MKKITTLFIALIAVSVYSSFAANHVAAQTSARQKYVIEADTSSLKNTPAFDVQIVKDSNSQKFILIVNNPSSQKLNISISAASTPGFKDQVTNVSYKKRIDMSVASDDYYTITVSNKKQTITKNFTLQTNSATDRSIVLE